MKTIKEHIESGANAKEILEAKSNTMKVVKILKDQIKRGYLNKSQVNSNVIDGVISQLGIRMTKDEIDDVEFELNEAIKVKESFEGSSINEAVHEGTEVKFMRGPQKGKRGTVMEVTYKIKMADGKTVKAKDGDFYNAG